MKRFLFLIICVLSFAIHSQAQVSQNARKIQSTTGAPTVGCTNGPPYTSVGVRTSNGHIYVCISGTWTDMTPAGGSAITNSALANQVMISNGTNAVGDADLTFVTDTLTVTKLGATTLTGTIAGGGQQLNNVIIGTTTPLAGSFTTIGASGLITSTNATSGIMLATGTSTAAKNIHLGTTGGDFYFGIQDNPATFFGQAAANESVLYSFTQPLTIIHGANNTTATTKFTATGINIGSQILTYKTIATAGVGVPPIYSAPAQSATKTGNFTVLSYTPPATAGTYRVGGVITTTSSTNTGTVQFTLDYVDSQGTTHTADIIPLLDAAGTSATTKTGASKEFHAQGWLFTINNSATAIALKVVITGSVSYTVTGSIEQIN